MSSRSSGPTRYRHTGSGSIDHTIPSPLWPVGAGASVQLAGQPEDALGGCVGLGYIPNRHCMNGFQPTPYPTDPRSPQVAGVLACIRIEGGRVRYLEADLIDWLRHLEQHGGSYTRTSAQVRTIDECLQAFERQWAVNRRKGTVRRNSKHREKVKLKLTDKMSATFEMFACQDAIKLETELPTSPISSICRRRWRIAITSSSA